MQYMTRYNSPIGQLLMAADDQGLTGLWMEGQKYYAQGLNNEHAEGDCDHPTLAEARAWLDIYFSGRVPGFTPRIHMAGTKFQQDVWNILLGIRYGATMTYAEIARIIAEQRGIDRMSAQAVGGAVARNKISVIIPCHRVLGAGGELTGYAGGIDRKRYLLELEGIHV